MNGLWELGLAVRRLRAEAGLSGAELARRPGVPQPSVSRLEACRRLADVTMAERLVSGAGPGAWRGGRAGAAGAGGVRGGPERRADAAVSMLAGQLRRRVLGCAVARSFSCAMVPALLRTACYAAAVAEARPGAAGDLSGLLDDAGRSFSFVVTEGALRTWPDGADMGGQLAWVGELVAAVAADLSRLAYAEADVTKTSSAGLHVIGYACTAAERDRLTSLGVTAIIPSFADRLCARPLPQ